MDALDRELKRLGAGEWHLYDTDEEQPDIDNEDRIRSSLIQRFGTRFLTSLRSSTVTEMVGTEAEFVRAHTALPDGCGPNAVWTGIEEASRDERRRRRARRA